MDPLVHQRFLGITVLMRSGRLFLTCFVVADQSLHVGEEVLFGGNKGGGECQHDSRSETEIPIDESLPQHVLLLTFSCDSIVLISAMLLSLKSILALHCCIRKASLSCRALLFASASCLRGETKVPVKRKLERPPEGKIHDRMTYLDGDEVLERLAHLQTFDMQVARV